MYSFRDLITSLSIAGDAVIFLTTNLPAYVNLTRVTGTYRVLGTLPPPPPPPIPDSDPPIVNIIQPQQGAIVMLNPNQPLTVSGDSADIGSGIDYVEVSLEGGPYVRASGTSNWAVTFNNVPQGLRTVRVRARDKAGNMSAVKTQGFTVQRSVGNAIVVTPANFRSILTNISSVDFTGSTSTYIQINGGHNMLAIPCLFENLEIEAEVFVVKSSPVVNGEGNPYPLQLQSRTWHHGDQYMCDGRAYKGAFEPTKSRARKELFHRSSNLLGGSGYCVNIVNNQVSYANLIGRWSKLMLRTRNLAPVNGITPVLLENFVDGVKVHEYIDNGNWFWMGSNQPVCYSCQYGNTGNRKPNEILNRRGEWALFRSDGDTMLRYKSLIARPI